MLIFNINKNNTKVNGSTISFPIFKKHGQKKFKYYFVQINRNNSVNEIPTHAQEEISQEWLEEFIQNNIERNIEDLLFNPINEIYQQINDYLLLHFENGKTKHKEKKTIENFFSRVPRIHFSAVIKHIKKHYENDTLKYINNVPLFLQCFTLEMKHIADDEFIHEKQKKKDRKQNKLKKEYILYSMQLLQLVGGRAGSHYTTFDTLNLFKSDRKRKEEQHNKFRLVNAFGEIIKLCDFEKKQEYKLAEILNTNYTIAKIAEEKKFSYMLITLTLPPCFHPNPTRGQNSFIGVLPSKAQRTLQKIWEDIRALFSHHELKAGDDFMGASVPEAHKDSTLHRHILLYCSQDNIELIKSIVKTVEKNTKERLNVNRLNFDIKEANKNYIGKNGKPVSGASYIFKYITKTFGSVMNADNNTLKNMALRWLYSMRGFDFFGIKRARTKFNFLCVNYKEYSHCFSEEINLMFEKRDYFTFLTKFQDFFSIVRDDNGKIKFVLFDFKGNDWTPFKRKTYLTEKLVIEKKIFTIFEVNNNIADLEKSKEDLSVDDLDVFSTENDLAFSSHDKACFLQKNYENELSNFKEMEEDFRVFTLKDLSLKTFLLSFNPFTYNRSKLI